MNVLSFQEPSGELGLDQIIDAVAYGTAPWLARPAAIRPSVAHAVCEGVGSPVPLSVRIVVALAGLSPRPGRLLRRLEPAHGLLDRRMIHREIEGTESLQDLPGAVNVVDPPAAVPATLGLLRPPEVVEGAATEGWSCAIARVCRAARGRAP